MEDLMQRIVLLLFFSLSFYSSGLLAVNTLTVPVLVYHNFDPVKKGSMTLSTARFESQLIWIKHHGYTVIPMRQLIAYLQGKINTLPAKSVVITADDGRKAVYTYMLPLAKKYHIPVTLFIFPGIISKAKYALTWSQLKELQQTGLFDVECHTYWHPNFRKEKKRLSQKTYVKLVRRELVDSKKVIETRLGAPVTVLAWPFGIYNDYVEAQARKAGYAAAFSIDYRYASRFEKMEAQPRFMMIQSQNMKTFEAIVSGRMQSRYRR